MPCAYCGKQGPLTREHIWPKWLHNTQEYGLKYHSAVDKVIPAEHVIKDVCSECNNGPLSKLDDYGKSLHHRYFGKTYQEVKRSTFKYDFEKLSKWLLKIAFNSARASHAPDADLLGLYGPCLIENECSPIHVGVSVALMGQLIAIDPASGHTKVSEIRWCRSGPIEQSEREAAVFSARTIMINSWYFGIAVMKKTHFMDHEAEMLMRFLPGEIIRPNHTAIKVPTLQMNAEGLLKHYSDKRHLYDEAAKRRRT